MPKQTSKVVGQFTAEFLKPSTHIVCVRRPGGYPEAISEHLHKVSLAPDGDLSNISDFADLVEITSSTAALDFVRLWTSLTTGIMVNRSSTINGTTEREIVPVGLLKRLSKYGLAAGVTPFYNRDNEFGCNAILSDAGFRQGRFALPTVSPVSGGFVVKRWIFYQFLDIRHRKLVRQVNYIQESVSTNGRYEMKVIHQQLPPALPQTHWFLPLLR